MVFFREATHINGLTSGVESNSLPAWTNTHIDDQSGTKCWETVHITTVVYKETLQYNLFIITVKYSSELF